MKLTKIKRLFCEVINSDINVRMDQILDLVFKNDRDGLRTFSGELSKIHLRDDETCSCGCSYKMSMMDYIANDGCLDFIPVIDIKTIKTLIEIGIIMTTDVDLLAKYASNINCQGKWDFFVKLIDIFDPRAIREWRSEYNATILHHLFFAYTDHDSNFFTVFRHLIEDIGMDPNVGTSPEGDDVSETVMDFAQGDCDLEIIRYLHEIHGMDINCAGRRAPKFHKPIFRFARFMYGNIKPSIDKFYDTLVYLRDHGYDFSADPRNIYGRDLSHFIKKRNLQFVDARFEAFVNKPSS